jgi:hypothetical protein
VDGYAVAELASLPSVPTAPKSGDPDWKPIQHYFGLTAFGINAYIARAAGDTLIVAHDETLSGQEEAYVVTAGRAIFVLDERTFEAPAGTIVVVRDARVRRSATALERGTTILAVGTPPRDRHGVVTTSLAAASLRPGDQSTRPTFPAIRRFASAHPARAAPAFNDATCDWD